jgi:hypothetical protein
VIAIAFLLFSFFSAWALLQYRTGEAFPGLGTLASRKENARLFGMHLFTSVAAAVCCFCWLIVVLVQSVVL